MEYSMSSNKGIITTSSLSSSSRSPSPSSSSPSTNYPPSPPAAVTSPSSSSSSSPNSPPTDLSPTETSLPSASWSTVFPATTTPVAVTVVVISSCAACKYLGRSCEENCVLATCFPANDLINFNAVHRVFGAINIIKVLQELPESQRADAVSSMVYEANARLRDPVYGSAGAICQLQRLVNDLQAHLAKAQAEVVIMQCQRQKQVSDLQAQLAMAQAEVVSLQCQQICMEMNQSPQASSPQQSLDNFANTPMSFLDDNNSFGSVWEPLWT